MQLIQHNQQLKSLSWWKVGGPAEHFAAPRNEVELKAVLAEARHQEWPVQVLSGGSNVLISDQGVKGLVLHMSQLRGVQVDQEESDLKATLWAGTSKAQLARLFLTRKLMPAVFLTGLPGDVGGGVVMNAGVGEAIEPREFCEIIEWVRLVQWPSLQEKKLWARDLKWGYRSSSLQSTGGARDIIVQVGVCWPNQPRAEVMQLVRQATQNRLRRQPLQHPSGGSTFKNPLPHKAGQLIEQCGLKGYRCGGASVSQRHANFIVNDQQATAKDVAAVVRHIQREVRQKTGISLEPEFVWLE